MGHFDDVNSPRSENEPPSPKGLDRAIEKISNLSAEELVAYSEAKFGPRERLLAMRACESLVSTSGADADDYLTALPTLWRLYDEVADSKRAMNQLDRFEVEFKKMTAQQLYDRASVCYGQRRTPELLLIEKELTGRVDQITAGNQHNFDETVAEETMLTTDYLEQVSAWVREVITEDSSL